MSNDEIAAEERAVGISAVGNAFVAAVVLDGDGVLLLLEDIALHVFRCAAREISDLAAFVEV